MKQLTEGHIEWTMPAPLWRLIGDPAVAENRLKFRTPTILRFATDSFMDELLDLLNTEPERLGEFVAAPEAWNSPPNEPARAQQKSGLMLELFRARNAAVRRLQSRGRKVLGEPSQAVASNASGVRALKLFQPVHQRFYLVACCLVCRMLGLPDRRIDAGAQERVTFVLRMLQPRAGAAVVNPDPRTCDELALVNGAWQLVSSPDSLFAGEEQHPLSPTSFVQDDHRRRRLLVGLIPVGDRERLLQAQQPGAGGTPPKPLDTRQMSLKTQVIGPINDLEHLAQSARDLIQKPVKVGSGLTWEEKQAILTRANDQIQQVSWYILLDLARYLETNIPDLWAEINNAGSGSNLAPEVKPLWNKLATTQYSGVTMLQALKHVYDHADSLESMTTTYNSTSATAGWPALRFSFYTAAFAGVQGLQPNLARDAFEDLIVSALPANNPNPPLPVRTVAQANVNPQAPVWFTIRCVLERPNCGKLSPPLLSEPTAAFQLAAYFDADAPSRPVRIGLPIDTTPAGLRKFDKNTAFVMSDTLCGQVTKMRGMSFADLIMSVLPFPLHQDLDGGGGQPCAGGMVCSFSIPIITIVALILLIIFVKLLDIVFFWMPFFQICLPLPNFSAKES